LKVFHTVKGVFIQSISAAEDYITGCLSYFAPSRIQQFLEWFRNISAIRSLPQDVEPAVLVDHILWAQKARRYFLDSLSAAFSTKDGALPRWVLTILKLGRYSVAARALVQLAIEFPAMYDGRAISCTCENPSRCAGDRRASDMCPAKSRGKQSRGAQTSTCSRLEYDGCRSSISSNVLPKSSRPCRNATYKFLRPQPAM